MLTRAAGIRVGDDELIEPRWEVFVTPSPLRPVRWQVKHFHSWATSTFTTSYGVAPDEQRFLMVRDLDVTPRPRVRLLVDVLR
jgi:hypothetical protein